MAWPILPRADGPGALVLIGQPSAMALAATDEAGAIGPPAVPSYAANVDYRVALIALPSGKHTVRTAQGTAEVAAEAGDALALVYGPYRSGPRWLGASLWRRGALSRLAWPVRPDPPALEAIATVDLDGQRLASFSEAEDVIAGRAYPVAPVEPPPPTTRVLPELAYRRSNTPALPALTVAETPAFDVHAFLSYEPFGIDGVVRSHAVIAVVPHDAPPSPK
jgi:hypothetical protein